jgi:hypothetical protein
MSESEHNQSGGSQGPGQSGDEHGNGPGPGGGGEGPGNNFVDITINDDPYRIHRGSQTVVEIKTVGHVPLADDLEQVINGVLTLVADDGRVVIHGGEVFASHPKTGSSS